MGSSIFHSIRNFKSNVLSRFPIYFYILHLLASAYLCRRTTLILTLLQLPNFQRSPTQQQSCSSLSLLFFPLWLLPLLVLLPCLNVLMPAMSTADGTVVAFDAASVYKAATDAGL